MVTMPRIMIAIGAMKGFFNWILDIAELLGAPATNVAQVKDFLHLRPSSQNQRFGMEVGEIAAMFLPPGEAGKLGELAKGAPHLAGGRQLRFRGIKNSE